MKIPALCSILVILLFDSTFKFKRFDCFCLHNYLFSLQGLIELTQWFLELTLVSNLGDPGAAKKARIKEIFSGRSNARNSKFSGTGFVRLKGLHVTLFPIFLYR